MLKKILWLSLISLTIASCATTKGKKPVYLQSTVDVDELPEVENKFDRFKQQILGHFSNEEQVQEDPEMGELEQEFIIVPILKDRPGEFWVYLEFFSPSLIDKPINHRVEQYRRISRDTFVMEVYLLKNPEKYVNAWKRPNPLKDLDTQKDLIRYSDCDLYIVAGDEPHTFHTVPPEEVSCELGGNAATKYVNLYFSLSDEGYNMRFQFYDDDKEILRETAERGLQFKRLDYRKEDYEGYK